MDGEEEEVDLPLNGREQGVQDGAASAARARRLASRGIIMHPDSLARRWWRVSSYLEGNGSLT